MFLLYSHYHQHRVLRHQHIHLDSPPQLYKTLLLHYIHLEDSLPQLYKNLLFHYIDLEDSHQQLYTSLLIHCIEPCLHRY